MQSLSFVMVLVISLHYTLCFVNKQIVISNLYPGKLRLYYREKKRNQSFEKDESKNKSFSPKKVSRNWQQSSPDKFIQELQKLTILKVDSESSDNFEDSTDKSNQSQIEKASLCALLNTHLSQMDTPMLASTLHSLGILKQRQMLPMSTSTPEIKQLVAAVCKNVIDFSLEDYVSALLGFSRLQITSNEIFNINPKFLANLSVYFDGMNNRQVGDILWSLANIGIQWNNLEKQLKYSILDSFNTRCHQFDGYTLSSILWAFSKMGVKSSELDRQTRKMVIDKLYVIGSDLSPQQSSKVIWSIGNLGFNGNLLEPDMIEIYLNNICQIKRSQIGNAISSGQTLTGMAKLGLTWDNCSPKVKSGVWEQLMRVSMSPNDKALANAIWAVGTLEATASTQPKIVFDTMIESTKRVINDCSSWTLCNIIWGKICLGYFSTSFSK